VLLACALGACASPALGCSSSGQRPGQQAPDDAGTSAGPDSGPHSGTVNTGSDGGLAAGWLYTMGNQIFVSSGDGQGTPWMGRGVNIDDIFLCGYNSTLSMNSPDQTLEAIVSGLISDWKPSFVRISLAMASDQTTASFTDNAAQYKTPMTNVITTIGANPGVYVLVTLRSDASMIGRDTADRDPEATGLPSDSSTTPNASKYPTGTDAVYVALVDTFAASSFVLFGLTNEPGGNKLSNPQIVGAMTHAVAVIRAEEDRLGVPHHLVSVQGNAWTSDISFYATAPMAHDNVVYEVHQYNPQNGRAYTYANLPVIVGEYGWTGGNVTASMTTAFYADVETKRIPNLAWDFEPYSNCAPDLVNVTHDASNLTPTPWGSIVQSYLLSHATQ
jgi:hypothetical protein